MEEVTNGKCGENITWTLKDDGTLILDGTGDMEIYNACQNPVNPWRNAGHDYRLKKIVISHGITSISKYAFYICHGVVSLAIPDSVTEIGSYAFFECQTLTSITIPNSIKFIEEDTFCGCTDLTSVIIGKAVRTIGRQAFYNCKSIETVTSLAKVPPLLDESAFDSSMMKFMSLNVPEESIEEYKSTAPWNQFGSITGFDKETKCDKPTITFDKNKKEIIVSPNTKGATVRMSIHSAEDNERDDNNAKTVVTAYSTKAGYENSDVTTVSFDYPIAGYATKEDVAIKEEPVEAKVEEPAISESNKEMEVFIFNNSQSEISLPTGVQIAIEYHDGELSLKNLPLNSALNIYTEDGELLEMRRAYEDSITLKLPIEKTYIIEISGKTFKVKI